MKKRNDYIKSLQCCGNCKRYEKNLCSIHGETSPNSACQKDWIPDLLTVERFNIHIPKNKRAKAEDELHLESEALDFCTDVEYDPYTAGMVEAVNIIKSECDSTYNEVIVKIQEKIIERLKH